MCLIIGWRWIEMKKNYNEPSDFTATRKKKIHACSRHRRDAAISLVCFAFRQPVVFCLSMPFTWNRYIICCNINSGSNQVQIYNFFNRRNSLTKIFFNLFPILFYSHSVTVWVCTTKGKASLWSVRHFSSDSAGLEAFLRTFDLLILKIQSSPVKTKDLTSTCVHAVLVTPAFSSLAKWLGSILELKPCPWPLQSITKKSLLYLSICEYYSAFKQQCYGIDLIRDNS